MENPVCNLSMQTPNSEGEIALIEGKKLRMRYWKETPREDKEMHATSHETLGFVLKGEALLHLGAKTLELRPGDSWCVPAGVEHAYIIKTDFEAVEVLDRQDA